MKVKDLMTKLGQFDPELPVCVADWQEEYSQPSELAAERVGLVEDGPFYPTGEVGLGQICGPYVCIGG